MTQMTRWILGLLLIVAGALPAAALSQQTVPADTVTPIVQAETRAQRQWWEDQRWRYADDAAAFVALQALESRQSPWPEWHQSNIVALPAGLRFQMAISPGQGTDQPGGFGTFEAIPDVDYVRTRLAVKVEWKPQIDRVVVYEITSPLLADVGTVGPQIDGPVDRYLPGGASQFQMMVPASERMQHLRVVEVRPIR